MGNYNIISVVICISQIFISQTTAAAVCPDDWELFGKHCYYISSSSGYSQSSALNYCETQYSSKLISINSEEENQFLWENIRYGTFGVWIGLYKEYGYDVPYEWTDGSELNYTNWFSSEPDYAGSSTYCVEMYHSYSDGFWADTSCFNYYRIACETEYVPAGTSNCSSTQFDCQNGQCLPSSWECDNQYDCTNGNDEKNCGGTGPSNCTNNEFDCLNGECLPLNLECDNYIQCSNGFDEQNCDSTVTTEFSTTEPGGPNSDVCPDNWMLFDKYCYYISPSTVYYQSSASDYCETHYNSTLISINSEEENQFLWGNIRYGSYGVWIGLYKEDGYDQPYEWTDGSELNYTNWYTYEPSYTGSSAYCVKMYYSYSDGKWADTECSNYYRFACETKYVPEGNSSCSSTQFDCLNGQCLPSSWECDDQFDCTNGNDELNCGVIN